MKKSTIYRAIFYISGLLILALGIVLNTKSGLGVSPIISISYSVSVIYGLNFGNVTFALYTVFVAVEIILHLIRRPEGALLLTLGKDLLQLPLSLAFTRFMNLFSALLPEPKPTPAAMPSGKLWMAMASTNNMILLTRSVPSWWLSWSTPTNR